MAAHAGSTTFDDKRFREIEITPLGRRVFYEVNKNPTVYCTLDQLGIDPELQKKHRNSLLGGIWAFLKLHPGHLLDAFNNHALPIIIEQQIPMLIETNIGDFAGYDFREARGNTSQLTIPNDRDFDTCFIHVKKFKEDSHFVAMRVFKHENDIFLLCMDSQNPHLIIPYVEIDLNNPTFKLLSEIILQSIPLPSSFHTLNIAPPTYQGEEGTCPIHSLSNLFLLRNIDKNRALYLANTLPFGPNRIKELPFYFTILHRELLVFPQIDIGCFYEVRTGTEAFMRYSFVADPKYSFSNQCTIVMDDQIILPKLNKVLSRELISLLKLVDIENYHNVYAQLCKILMTDEKNFETEANSILKLENTSNNELILAFMRFRQIWKATSSPEYEYFIEDGSGRIKPACALHIQKEGRMFEFIFYKIVQEIQRRRIPFATTNLEEQKLRQVERRFGMAGQGRG